jgi:hypothetical protein
MALYLLSPLLLANGDKDAQSSVILRLGWLDDHGQFVDKELSLSDLDTMPKTSITLELPESLDMTGEHSWQGVSLSSLIALSGRRADSLKVTALDGYSIIVPGNDIERFNPTLAYRRDGMLISVLDKGPLTLIYPFDKFPELNRQVYLNRVVWQVNAITLQ